MSAIIFILSIFLFALGLFALCRVDVITSKSFWWSTWNGTNWDEAKLEKIKGLPLYYVTFKCNYKHPKRHPDFKDFADNVKLKMKYKKGLLLNPRSIKIKDI